VETKEVTNFLHRIAAAGVGSADGAVPIYVLLCEGRERLGYRRPHPGLWYLAQITAIRNLTPQRIDENVGSQEHLVLQLRPRRCPADAIGNETDISSNSFRCGLAKYRQNPSRFQPVRRTFVANCRAITAPGPFSRSPHHSRSDRVEHHVAHQFQQIGFFLDQDGFVSSLEDVPDPVMGPVEVLCVNTVELPHSFGEIAFRSLYQQVIMIAHQAIGMNRPVEALRNAAKDCQEKAPVCIRKIDVLSPVTSSGHVVGCASKLKTKGPCHVGDSNLDREKEKT
jgi:hypothetical protein